VPREETYRTGNQKNCDIFHRFEKVKKKMRVKVCCEEEEEEEEEDHPIWGPHKSVTL
jgi:hypothetical protein